MNLHVSPGPVQMASQLDVRSFIVHANGVCSLLVCQYQMVVRDACAWNHIHVIVHGALQVPQGPGRRSGWQRRRRTRGGGGGGGGGHGVGGGLSGGMAVERQQPLSFNKK